MPRPTHVSCSTALRISAAVIVAIASTLGVISPAAASDVDLGQPSTISELLDSPEYRNEHAGVLRLYLAFLDRQPDVSGAKYWIDQYSDGAREDDLAWGFSQSVEFAQQYGSSLENSEFLTIVYSNVLGRSPDEDGFAYWLGEMNRGLAKHEVVRWIVANDEFINRAPFERTSPDLTTALVSVADVDPSLVAFVIDGPSYRNTLDVPLSACERPLALPNNAQTSFFVEDVDMVANMTTSSVTNDVYGFSDPGRAAARVAEIKRSFADECSSFVDGLGGTNTYSNVSVPAFCSECVMWEQANVSPNFGGRVFYTRGMAIRVGYSISILEISNWTRPGESELTVPAMRVHARLEQLIGA